MFKIEKELLQKINLASFWAFLAFGVGFILIEILKKNGIGSEQINFVERALDLPFVFIALVYALSAIKLAFTGGSEKFGNILVALGILAFVAVLYVSIFVADL